MFYAVFGAALRQKTGGLYLYGKDKLFCWTKQIKMQLFFGKRNIVQSVKWRSERVSKYKGLGGKSCKV